MYICGSCIKNFSPLFTSTAIFMSLQTQEGEGMTSDRAVGSTGGGGGSLIGTNLPALLLSLGGCV